MGKLYLVATPIGNLEDVSPRALRVLQEAHMVACEDTRHTQLLLRRYEIRAKHLTSYNDFNHRRRAAELVGQLDRGWDVALVSDAGTPALSDPGEALV
ncbi:MAG: SAM-dependent methyltransferase, partial [Candidatus Limnocylindria bacterium]